MTKLQIEYKNIEDLIPYINNPRINDNAVDEVAGSIAEFGFKNPIIIDEDNVIIAGHTRLLASRKLNLKEVPTIKVDDLTDAQIKAYRIADNRTGEFADWDFEKLNIELEDIGDLFTGFDHDDIEAMLSDNKYDDFEVEEDDFEVEIPDEPISKRGQIYQLGKHRLMCGDSTTDDVDKLMDGNKADMVFTDPPYGINYGGGRGGGHGQIKNDDLKGLELGNLISRVFTNIKSEADVYICVSPIMQKSFLIALGDKKLDAVIVWDKRNPGLGYMAYRRQCEFIYFIKGEPFRKGDKSDIDLWSISKGDTSAYVHGTQKPIAVPARAIENSSKKGDSILDLFGGSGSTLIACEQLDRICYMMELDEKYVDVIINRWEQYTGQKAVLISE